MKLSDRMPAIIRKVAITYVGLVFLLFIVVLLDLNSTSFGITPDIKPLFWDVVIILGISIFALAPLIVALVLWEFYSSNR